MSAHAQERGGDTADELVEDTAEQSDADEREVGEAAQADALESAEPEASATDVDTPDASEESRGQTPRSQGARSSALHDQAEEWLDRARRATESAQSIGELVRGTTAQVLEEIVLTQEGWPSADADRQALREHLGISRSTGYGSAISQLQATLAEHQTRAAQIKRVEGVLARSTPTIDDEHDALPWWYPARLLPRLNLWTYQMAAVELAKTRRHAERDQIIAERSLRELTRLQEEQAAAQRDEESAARLDAAVESTARAQARADELVQRARDERARLREEEELARLEVEQNEQRAAAERRNRQLRTERVDELSAAASNISAMVTQKREFEDRLARVHEMRDQQLVRLNEHDEREASIQGMMPTDPSRAERATRLFDESWELRARQRRALDSIGPRLGSAQAELASAQEEYQRMLGALRLWEDSASEREESLELATLGLEVRETRVETASLSMEMSQLALDTLVEQERFRMEILRQEALRMDRLFHLLPKQQQRQLRRITSQNMERASDNFVDRALLRRDEFELLLTWADSLRSKIISVDGVIFSTRMLLRLFLLLGFWWLAIRYRTPFLRSWLQTLERQAALRRSHRMIFKTAEILHALTPPVAIILGLRWATAMLLPPPPWDELISSALILILLALMTWRSARCIFLPSTRRRQRLIAPDEPQNRWCIDLFDPDWENRKYALMTTQMLILVFLGGRLAVITAEALIGEDLITTLIRRTVFWLLFFLIYLLSWWWRHTIVESFIRLANLQSDKLVKRLRKHRDRPYSVFILAFLMIYVVAGEGLRRVSMYAGRLRISRKIQNFLFRKRVELAQAGDAKPKEVVNPLSAEELAAFFNPLPQKDVLVPRPRELELVLDAYADWLSDQSEGGAVAVVGEIRSGKSAFLYQIAEALPDKDSHHLVEIQDRPLDDDDLYALLNRVLKTSGISSTEDALKILNDGQKRILLIDDAHILFLRRIGGFTALDTFLNIVALSSENTFWVLSFGLYAWQFIHKVSERRHFFARAVNLRPFSDKMTRELIQNRVNACGVELDFRKLLTTDRQDKQAYYEAIKSEEGYYRMLNEFAEGNPAVALAYFIKSLGERDGDTISVQLYERPPDAWLRDLTDDQMFMLATIALHKQLDPDSLSIVLSRSIGGIELDMHYLEERDAIEIDRRRRVRLTPLLFRQVIKRLQDANFLYSTN